MTTLSVYVIGFGDLNTEFFNAIAATVNSVGYHHLLKLMILLLWVCWTLVVSACRQQLYLEASTQFEVTQDQFQKKLQHFVQQCVFYDVLLRNEKRVIL